MTPEKRELLSALPLYQDEWIKVKDKQEVKDIIAEVLASHEDNRQFYDRIALYFDNPDLHELCKGLYEFCKNNFRYYEETEDRQNTFTPQGALTVGKIDCKGYAGFCGGVLDGINRLSGSRINWNYRFASYSPWNSTPGHVFIVVNDMGREIWIDPTPGAEDKKPVWEINKKVSTSKMGLYKNIGGVSEVPLGVFTKAGIDPLFPNWQRDYINPHQTLAHEPVTVGDIDAGSADYIDDLSDTDYRNIEVLQKYGVLDARGNISQSALSQLPGKITPQDEALLNSSYYAATVGNWFDDAFKFVQHNAAILGQQVPRAAFLGLVAINAFGYATKLQKALSYDDSHAKLADIWERLGGKFSVLVSTINSGAKKKALLKGVGTARGDLRRVGVLPAAALIAAAATVVAAIMPLITKLLDKHHVPDPVPLDPTTGLPYGMQGGGTGIMAWIRNNPVPSIGIAVLVGYAIINSKDL